jgi:hypothetical protein
MQLLQEETDMPAMLRMLIINPSYSVTLRYTPLKSTIKDNDTDNTAKPV